MQPKKSRWALAQEYEKNWWNKRNEIIDLEYYQRFANELIEFSKDFVKIDENTKFLEIGSGAFGILTYINITSHRYALDPLEKFYSITISFTRHRDNAVKYLSAKGENIPIKSKSIDFIIMDNVLDHCDDPTMVIDEIKRVIKKGGLLYFRQNTYHIWGKGIRFLMEKLIIDRGHPYTFSKKDLRKLFRSFGFEILKSKRTGYLFTLKNEILSNSWKDKLKIILLVTRDKVTYLVKI